MEAHLDKRSIFPSPPIIYNANVSADLRATIASELNVKEQVSLCTYLGMLIIIKKKRNRLLNLSRASCRILSLLGRGKVYLGLARRFSSK